MASVDGARAVKSASDESFRCDCSPCENDGKIKEALFYCQNCKDYLCENCETLHKRFRGTRDHNVVRCEEMSQESQETVPSRYSIYCCNDNEATIVCKVHNEIVCSDCKTIKHRQCQTHALDEVVNELELNFDDEEIKQAEGVRDELEKLLNERKQTLEEIAVETKNCKVEIMSCGAQIKEQIDKMQDDAIRNLYKLSNLHENIIEHHIDVCETAIRKLSLDLNNHKKHKDFKIKGQSFFTYLKLRQILKDLDYVINDVKGEVYRPRVLFRRNESIFDLFNSKSLGIIYNDSSGRSKLLTRDMNISVSQGVSVTRASDKTTPWISGSVFLEGGELVLVDRNNDCLKVFDQELTTLIKCIELSGKPRDCCLKSQNELIVTLPGNREMQWFQTSPFIKLVKSVYFDKVCEGVASIYEEVLVSCHSSPEKEVQIFCQDGTLRKIISLTENDRDVFLPPIYLKVAFTGDFFISESVISQVSQIRCFTKDGICKYKFSDPHLRVPAGILVGFDCSLLVCYYTSNTIRLIDKDGKGNTEIFPSGFNISNPYSMSVREMDNTFVVTRRDVNEMLVCKIK